MNALAIIFNIVLILISIVLIALVLMQQGQRQGLGAIAGGAETFFGKNNKGLDAKLAKFTKIAAVVFIVLAIATTMIVSHNSEYSATAGVSLDGDHIHLQDGTTVDLTSATEEQLALVGLTSESVPAYLEALEAAMAGAEDHGDHVHNEDGTITDLEGNVITEEEAHGAEEAAEETAVEETDVPAEETETTAE